MKRTRHIIETERASATGSGRVCLPRRGRGERGVALILALLFVVLMTVLVVEFTYEAQVRASMASNQAGDFGAYLAAKSAVAQGMALLREDLLDAQYNGEPYYDSLLDPIAWAEGQPFQQVNEALMRASIADEYGKINLNALIAADGSGAVTVRQELAEILMRFFEVRLTAGTSDIPANEILDSILDWLDGENDAEERPGGVEADFYDQAKVPYAIKDGPMDSIEELLLVRGITPEFYFGDPEYEQLPLSEYLTVHGDWAGRINVNTARPEILEAAALALEQHGMTLDYQGILDRTFEAPFFVVEDLEPYLQEPRRERNQPARGRTAQPEASGPPSANAIPMYQKLFVVSSNVFRIFGDGMMDDVLVRIEAYVWRTPDEFDPRFLPPGAAPPQEPFRILSWKVIR